MFFTVTLVDFDLAADEKKKSLEIISVILNSWNLNIYIQHVQYYQNTCYCIRLTKKSNSFMCTWTSSVWVMEHFAVLHHVVLCTFFLCHLQIYQFPSYSFEMSNLQAWRSLLCYFTRLLSEFCNFCEVSVNKLFNILMFSKLLYWIDLEHDMTDGENHQ